jgi:type VI secretion system secreted protein VgrG
MLIKGIRQRDIFMGLITQADRLLEVTTCLGKDVFILTSFKGREGLSTLFSFQLEMFSNKTDISPKELIGKPISFLVNKDSTPRYFHGMISRFHMGTQCFPSGRYYRAEVVPWLWFLSCTSDCRIYQNKTTDAIMADIFKRFGFNDYSLKYLQNSYQQRSYCVQYGESAFNFISRLMEEEGIFYFFKHEKNKHTLMIADNNTAFEEVPGEEINYASINSHADDAISYWEHQHNFATGKQTHSYYDFERPTTQLQKSFTTLVDIPSMKDYETYHYVSTYDATRGDETQVKTYMESQDSHYELIQGTSSYSSFQIGCKLDLNIPFEKDSASEKKLCTFTEITHQATDHTRLAHDRALPKYTNSFTATPLSLPYRPPITTLKPRIIGTQTAVVVGPPGEEIYTDEYGRIKVQFHWDRIGQNDDKSSCWIRLAQTWAGNQWGIQFIPRVGQEVVVSFLDGDPDQPLVIACIYNANQKPPYSLPANSTQSGIKTHSSKDGSTTEANELRFEDKKGQEQIFMHAQKDFSRVVENDDSLQVKNNQSVTIMQNREVTVSKGDETTTIQQGKRSVIVESGDDIKTVKQGNYSADISAGKSTTTAGSAIELSVGSSMIKMDTTSITIQSGQNVIKLEPQGITVQGLAINLKADTSLKAEGMIAEVDGTGMLTLKGAITMIN